MDNGWLAAALMVVKGAVPALRGKADRILREMNFGFYFNPAATPPIGVRGLIRGGFWDTQPPELLGARRTASGSPATTTTSP